MLYSKGSIVGILGLALPVLANPLEGRAVSTKTMKSTITSTSVATVATQIATGISTTGVATIIPNALTMTFKNVPAYLYLETTILSTKVVTTTITSIVKVTLSTTTTKAAVVSTAKAASSSAKAASSSPAKAASSSRTTTAVVVATTSAAVSQQCGVLSDGPTELGWETSAGNQAASSWAECYWICMARINYCQSFAFAMNGAMPSGEECILMKAKTTAAGIWNNVGTASGNFALYDATCTPPVAKNPVTISSQECGITSNNMGGPSLETLQTAEVGKFGANTLAECKAKCQFFTGYCASYYYYEFGPGAAYGNCGIYSVTIEAPGAYENMNQTGQYVWYSYDAGC